MEHTQGNWGLGDITAKYKPFPETHYSREKLKEYGLDKPFDCISIGNMDAQIALVPTDNPNSEANAKLIAAAPDLLEALKELIDPLTGLVYDSVTIQIATEKAFKIEIAIKKATK